MRVDKYLAEHGYTESRQKAKELISGCCVLINGKTVTKDSQNVEDSDTIELIGRPHPYVGRGGLKLEAAKREFSIDFKGKIACDIGASTGGFTDVMLRSGVEKVFAVDCGRGQLHPDIAGDARVTNLEGTNARELTAEMLGTHCDIATADLSFISQTLVYDAVTDILEEGGEFVSLVKPQFEAGREHIGKGGIVKDARVHMSVMEKIIDTAHAHSLFCDGVIISPIKGGDGNTEYLAHFRYLPQKSAEMPKFDLRETEKMILKGITK